MRGRCVMPRQDPLDIWRKDLAKAFPDLTKPQLKGLAHWSFGMTLARCCSLDSVAAYMADWLEQPELSVRSRLREWYLPADLKSGTKRGDKRQDLDVTTVFAPCCAGCAAIGLYRVWLWPWMPPLWTTASCYWPSAYSTMVVPSRWP